MPLVHRSLKTFIPYNYTYCLTIIIPMVTFGQLKLQNHTHQDHDHKHNPRPGRHHHIIVIMIIIIIIIISVLLYHLSRLSILES